MKCSLFVRRKSVLLFLIVASFILGVGPRFALALCVNMGNILLANGHADRTAIFDSILQSPSLQSPALCRLRLRAAQARAENLEAIRIMEKCPGLFGSDDDLRYLRLGEAYARLGDLETAQDIWRGRPNICRYFYHRALELIEGGDLGGALEELQSLEAWSPAKGSILYLEASVYEAQEQFDLALEYLQRALDEIKVNPAANEVSLAVAYYKTRRMARSQGREVLRLRPSDPLVYVQFAKINAKLGNTNEAIMLYSRALRIERNREWQTRLDGLLTLRQGKAYPHNVQP